MASSLAELRRQRLSELRDRLARLDALEAAERAEQASRYLTDPVGWARDVLGVHLWSRQREIAELLVTEKRVAVRSAHGTGKALYTESVLPTPSGWTTMADIQVGDELLDENGKPTRVVAKSDVQYRPTYRVTFDDRTEIVAADDHSWQVVDLRHRPRSVDDWRNHWAHTVTKTTAEIAETLRFGEQYRWRVPTCRPIEGQTVDMPVPPYTLGAWLGDGTSLYAAITAGYEDAPETLGHIETEGIRTRARPSAMRERSGCWGLLGLVGALRGMGLLGNKHIPERVFRADVDTRLAVLQGVMDTDGFVGPGQSVGIDLCDERLAADVAALVRTFGWKAWTKTKPAKLYGRVVGTVYRLAFRPDLPVFRLRRKAERLGQVVRQTSRHTVRTIVNVEQIETLPTQCVEVDSPSHLYLAGESYVPTHNSFLSSILALWWASVHPTDQVMVVSTAPTYEQVHSIVWEEIRRNHRRADLVGDVQLSDRWVVDGRLIGLGRKPADQHSFQGLHNQYVLCLIDESCGVPAWLWTAVEAITTGPDCRTLAIGNPDDVASEFARVCQRDTGWAKVRINAFDSPNLSGEEVPPALRDVLVSREWVEDKRERWGESSPLYQSKVLGEFADADDGLIPYSWVVAAQQRWQTYMDELPAGTEPPGRSVFGVDVASTGDDVTCIARKQGPVVYPLERWATNAGPIEVAELVRARLYEHPKSEAIVDAIGEGKGTYEALRRWGLQARPFVASAATKVRDSSGTQGFRNVRSAAWWAMREALDPRQGATLCLPPDDDLAAELTAPRYQLLTGAKIAVEGKDDVRKRLGRSTDAADAVVQAVWGDGTLERDLIPGEKPRRPARARQYAGSVTWG